MLRHDCFHLKRVTKDDYHEKNHGTLRCDVNRAAPDGTTVAGMTCVADCMAYRKMEMKEKSSPFSKIKNAFKSLVGKT